MQLLTIAMARWVLPVPVPPTKTMRWAMKPLPPSSLTSVRLIGDPVELEVLEVFGQRGLAMVSRYLIERACFSLISALSRWPRRR